MRRLAGLFDRDLQGRLTPLNGCTDGREDQVGSIGSNKGMRQIYREQTRGKVGRIWRGPFDGKLPRLPTWEVKAGDIKRQEKVDRAGPHTVLVVAICD